MAKCLDHPGQTSSDLSTVRAWPAPWSFGVLILPLGTYIGFIWTALPFLLSKSGVPIEGISRIAAILQIPPLLMFLWTPIVDVKLRRRTWLVLAAVSSSICVFLACPLIGSLHFNLLTALLFLSGAVLALVFTSCGGLMATLLSPSGQAKAAAWNQAGNFGGVHYDRPSGPYRLSFWPEFFWFGFLEELIYWVSFTVTLGSLAGSVAALMAKRRMLKSEEVA